MKTSELTGAALDWAVASIEKLPSDLLMVKNGLPVVQRECLGYIDLLGCKFSTAWVQGGAIIEREGFNLCKCNGHWEAITDGYIAVGPTPLIAAMRCYVASKLGDEIELPEELV